ncbi:hypothetical protein DB31_8137 [Hyalangium minutum]|uniref:Uncharacterized protein n=1 Tax=Hyalangium minutum TaxID=394096 RepID=A0A085WIZ1_9BACT|nr:hypothetical protein DB31_8137 [Hyalangium minutum]
MIGARGPQKAGGGPGGDRRGQGPLRYGLAWGEVGGRLRGASLLRSFGGLGGTAGDQSAQQQDKLGVWRPVHGGPPVELRAGGCCRTPTNLGKISCMFNRECRFLRAHMLTFTRGWSAEPLPTPSASGQPRPSC